MSNASASVDTSDMRLFCRTRDTLQRIGEGDDSFFALITNLRRAHIQTVGLKKYLADMLSYHAGKPANYCTAFYGGQVIQGKSNKRILDFIMELAKAHPSKLPPNRVEIREAGSIRTYNI